MFSIIGIYLNWFNAIFLLFSFVYSSRFFPLKSQLIERILRVLSLLYWVVLLLIQVFFVLQLMKYKRWICDNRNLDSFILKCKFNFNFKCKMENLSFERAPFWAGDIVMRKSRNSIQLNIWKAKNCEIKILDMELFVVLYSWNRREKFVS